MPWIKLQSEYPDLDKYKAPNEAIVYYEKNTYTYHNPYGPAYITIYGDKFYFKKGSFHRLDGPARILPPGNETYYINGQFLTEEEFEKHPERLKFLGKEHLIFLI